MLAEHIFYILHYMASSYTKRHVIFSLQFILFNYRTSPSSFSSIPEFGSIVPLNFISVGPIQTWLSSVSQAELELHFVLYYGKLIIHISTIEDPLRYRVWHERCKSYRRRRYNQRCQANPTDKYASQCTALHCTGEHICHLELRGIANYRSLAIGFSTLDNLRCW